MFISDSEEALLEQALVMSNQPMSSFEETPTPDLGAMTEEEQIAYALQMSLRQTVVGRYI